MSDRTDPGRVCVLYTGGTIGMRSMTPDLDLAEQSMFGQNEIERVLGERSDLLVPYDFRPLLGRDSHRPLVSSRIGPKQWKLIARTIEHHYSHYAGFVVLHGTDTMAWTASALSFMLTNLAKPVVLTGSQKPILAAPSDAVSNFVNSVMIAGRGHESIPPVPEVIVCFGDLVLRGNRSTKISTTSLQGFDTPNIPHLGRVGRRFEINAEQIRPAPAKDQDFFVRLELEHDVADVMMYPGMSAKQVERALKGKSGAVLRTFGAGNPPGGTKTLKVLEAAVAKGTVLINVTQCNEGTVEAGMLTGTRRLADCGVMTGVDLTAEAALTKLMVLLGSERPGIAAEQMQLDQRGEQSTDVIELRAATPSPAPASTRRTSTESAEGSVSRLVLTSSLHARVGAGRLVSAVLRLQTSLTPEDQTQPSAVTVYLNHWRADRSTGPNVLSLGKHEFAPDADRQRHKIVIDATKVARRVLAAGGPVTLTVVWSNPSMSRGFEVVLSLFTQRPEGYW